MAEMLLATAGDMWLEREIYRTHRYAASHYGRHVVRKGDIHTHQGSSHPCLKVGQMSKGGGGGGGAVNKQMLLATAGDIWLKKEI